jgi:YidC/Oxa1 family membrane protein insertase
VSIGPEKDKFTPELRILVASLLSMAVILLWTKFFAPKPVLQPQANRPSQAAPSTAGSPTSIAGAASSSTNTAGMESGKRNTASSVSGAAPASNAISSKSDTQERTTVIENDLYRVEIFNRGAVVKSWQLKNYRDDAKPPRILDVVHPEAAEQSGAWPFALVLDDEELQKAANTGLYQLSPASSLSQSPSDAEFSWSDGHLEITKHFHFDHSYVARLEVTATQDGKPITVGIGWLGGFGDLTVKDPAPWETVYAFTSENEKISTTLAKKLEGPEKVVGLWQGGLDFAGIEDRYFAAAFLGPRGETRGTLRARAWKVERTIQMNGRQITEPVAQVAVSSAVQPIALRAYVGPKDYDDLKKMNPPLHGLVNFGWMEIIADPLFHALKWIHKYVPNWGWAIVVLTLVVNMLLFPMRISSYKTTLKMQRVGPEIKAIQERYKKYSLRDPKKAEMNKEVMAVYSREGINPVGGCFQMFLQMPVWFGLNTALRYAIEMRHARWFGWITDLSSRDPYYVLPVAMGVSMYLVSKMTPITSTDPQQQMMMKIMPATMSVVFIVSPISSGLAVYILTSSIVGVVQQWYLNRKHPVVVPVKSGRAKKP